MPKHYKCEIAVYFAAWTAAVLYSIYRVYLATDRYFYHYEDAYNDFDPTWKLSFINRKVDVSDEEWRMWVLHLNQLLPWIFWQVSISQSLKLFLSNTTALCIWYILMSITFLWTYFGLLCMMGTLILPFISSLLMTIRSKSLSWIVHSVILVLIYWVKVSEEIVRKYLLLTYEEYFMLTGAICWIQMRSISYSIDSINNYKHENLAGFFKNLLQNLAYCLYLPTLFLGPVILYQEFIDGINQPFSKWNKTKIKRILFDTARYTFWMLFTHTAMHFLYFNAIKFHPKTVRTLDSWAFYGLGYCWGQYFFNKYLVIYGLTSTICRAEDIDAPPQPKCIGRIHLYSDMWKHFDRGLYKFLLKYIYIPCNPRSVQQKFFTSALCFAFICLWHGMELYIFMWSLLNFIGIVIEMLVKSAKKFWIVQDFLYSRMSPGNVRRFECALSSPLLALSAISNFYFFAEKEIGDMFTWRTLKESWGSISLLLFVLYCCCQTSTEVKQWEEEKMRRKEEIKSS